MNSKSLLLWNLINLSVTVTDSIFFGKLVNEKQSEYKRHGGANYVRNLLL